MKLQVLLSVMHQKDRSVVKRANIQTDAIIVNQADEFKKEVFGYKGSKIEMYTFDERGVGLSRNNALMRANADVVVFGDEDIRYVDDYEHIILSEFQKEPKADMIIFNVPSDNLDRPTYHINRYSRVRLRNCLRYGAVKMAIRTSSLRYKNVTFSLLFGGGALYSSGEDSLFIYNVIKSGLRVYATPAVIGSVAQDDSTWFQGYNEKFFKDKGALFYCLSPKFSHLFIIQFIIRKYKSMNTSLTVWQALRLMFAGAKLASMAGKRLT